MGMPVVVDIPEDGASTEILERVFSYLKYTDEKFSPFKETSEITAINKGLIGREGWSEEMKTIINLSKQTENDTNGYFNIELENGKFDISGMVKGWAINEAAKMLDEAGFKNFYVDVGGDIEMRGKNLEGKKWRVGIQNPFNPMEVIKVVHLSNKGIATSGTYIRGEHIYNPIQNNSPANEIVSLTIIGPNVYEADRFATASFAMGNDGIAFVEGVAGLEGYAIDKSGIATMTSGFEKYTNQNA